MRTFGILIGLLGLAACQSEHTLVAGLTQKEANEILVVLDTLDINAKKQPVEGRMVTYEIIVPAALQKKALRALVENHLPRENSVGLAQVYPPGGGGLIPSRSEEGARYLMALQGEIENMIKILPGVVSARVVIVKPDAEAIRGVDVATPKTTASVAVVYNPVEKSGKPVLQAREIRELVASSVENLDYNHVSVVMTLNRPMLVVGTKEAKIASGAAHKLATTVFESESSSVQENAILPPPAIAPSIVAATSPKPSVPVATAKAHPYTDKQLLWGFAGLAAVAVLVGLFGFLRSMSLGRQLLKAKEQLHEQHG